MNSLKSASVILVIFLSACGTSKSYFTSDVRSRIESNHTVSVDKLQFYIDRDVELRRVVSSRDTKVTSGKVRLVNGKYVNIIKLKKNTPGICTGFYTGSLNIAFESGDGQYLTFGVPNYTSPGSGNVYQILAQAWINSTGKVIYQGDTYYIQPGGTEAKLLIDKSVVDKFDVKKRTMHGRVLD